MRIFSHFLRANAIKIKVTVSSSCFNFQFYVSNRINEAAKVNANKRKMSCNCNHYNRRGNLFSDKKIKTKTLAEH